jgi:hypothetical protein
LQQIKLRFSFDHKIHFFAFVARFIDDISRIEEVRLQTHEDVPCVRVCVRARVFVSALSERACVHAYDVCFEGSNPATKQLSSLCSTR